MDEKERETEHQQWLKQCAEDRESNLGDVRRAIGMLELLEPALAHVRCSIRRGKAALKAADEAIEEAIERLDRVHEILNLSAPGDEDEDEPAHIPSGCRPDPNPTIDVSRVSDFELPSPSNSDVYQRVLIVDSEVEASIPYTGPFDAARDAYARANHFEPLAIRSPLAFINPLEALDPDLRVYRRPDGELVVLQS